MDLPSGSERRRQVEPVTGHRGPGAAGSRHPQHSEWCVGRLHGATGPAHAVAQRAGQRLPRRALARREARPRARARHAGSRGPRRRGRRAPAYALWRHAPAGGACPHLDGRPARRPHGRAVLGPRRDHADAAAGACRQPARRAHGAAGHPRPAGGVEARRAHLRHGGAARPRCRARPRRTVPRPGSPATGPCRRCMQSCWNGSRRPTMPGPTGGSPDGGGPECTPSG